jgi:hypothetical protein
MCTLPIANNKQQNTYQQETTQLMIAGPKKYIKFNGGMKKKSRIG